jgi:TetR/AcrR family transcriptional repressor of multidrug resistance operon
MTKNMTKRTKILTAAETILAEHGFYAFSMQNLADTAGVAAGTIYRYFASKEALMDELQKFIREEAAKSIFTNWQDSLKIEQKYQLMWGNAFNAVLNNPKRLAVIEMLYCVPNINQADIMLFEDCSFKRLIDFYQQGIDKKQFLDWSIPALLAISFDSSINLAKKVIRGQFSFDQKQLDQIRDASWKIIQNPHFKQQD